MDAQNAASTKPLYRGTQIVWYILGVIEVILALRLVLKLLGANSAAGFTSFVYTISKPLAGPFLNVFGNTKVSGSVFEWTTVLAMLVFWLVAFGIVKLFIMSKSVSTPEAAEKLDRQE